MLNWILLLSINTTWLLIDDRLIKSLIACLNHCIKIIDWLDRRWLAKLVLFTSGQPKKNKMAFVGILWQIKLLFGSPVIQLVWYILKQLFTSVSVRVADIYLAASRLGEYPPLFTSTSVNNCLLFSNVFFLIYDLQSAHLSERSKYIFRDVSYMVWSQVSVKGKSIDNIVCYFKLKLY